MRGCAARFRQYARSHGWEILEDELNQGGGGMVFLIQWVNHMNKTVKSVVKLIDSPTSDERDQLGQDILLRMPYLATLWEEIGNYFGNGKVFSIDKICQIGADVCRGLEHCHRASILHRDIKPENIFYRMVGGEAQYLIGDFGIAGSLHSATRRMTLAGTEGYRSPEVEYSAMLGEEERMEQYQQADIFGAGMVLYQLLVGNLYQFTTSRRQALLMQSVIQKDRLRSASKGEDDLDFSKISSEVADDSRLESLKRVINTACRLNPQKRYQSAREMGQALRQVLQPVAAEKPVLPSAEKPPEKAQEAIVSQSAPKEDAKALLEK